MEQTGIKVGKNGFEKEKEPEKLPVSVQQRYEYKTHITDAWDTLFIGLNFYYTEPGGMVGGFFENSYTALGLDYCGFLYYLTITNETHKSFPDSRV